MAAILSASLLMSQNVLASEIGIANNENGINKETVQTETPQTEASREENHQNVKPQAESPNTTSSIPEYVTENATASNVKISGFHIDPSQYGKANISENTRIIYRFLVISKKN